MGVRHGHQGEPPPTRAGTGRGGSAGRRSAIGVGGGVGGLAAAIGLRRIGWAVTVLEQAPQLRAVGSGWVHTGAEVTGVKEAGDQVSVTYRTAQGPRQAAVELLVAADGTHSTAPRLLWPEAPPPLLRTLASSW
jgi:2-polyprenyl-6-methoxyphenol hydroxylase-like FAD-dependent oxidoreductase